MGNRELREELFDGKMKNYPFKNVWKYCLVSWLINI